MDDTSPEIKKYIHDRMMALTGEERVKMACRMYNAARKVVWASFPEHLSLKEKKILLYERFYGEPLPKEAQDRL